MKIKNKSIILYFIIAILIVGFLTTVVVASVSDLSKLPGTKNQHIGEAYTLSYAALANNQSMYCIQHGKPLRGESKFILKDYVEIDGTIAQVYNNSSQNIPIFIESGLNAQVAYILSKKQGYGTSSNYTQAQKALWHITNSWTTTIFGNSSYSWSGNASVAENELNKEAERYAESIASIKSTYNVSSTQSNLKVTDKTNKDNIAMIDAGDYYRVGPFRWEFDGILQEIVVRGDVGTISNSNVRFVKYSGTNANTVNVSDILTGEAFYIDVNKGTGISRLTGLKLRTNLATGIGSSTKIYTAKIWFFQSSSYQNLIFVDVDEVNIPAEGEGEANYDINFAISIGLTKVDDRNTNIPLNGVGFTFSATIQTYDMVGHTDHYKNVNCSHVVTPSYIDGSGIFHDATYQHNFDTVLDWVQYHYEWKDHTMYLDSSNMWDESSKNTYYTNNAGQISINNIKYPTKTIINETSKGSSYISTARLKAGTSVTATEVSNPYYGYDIGNTYTMSLNSNTQLASKTVTNHQKRVKLSGYVWIDGNAEKKTIRNDEFDKGEEGFNGITVYLIDKSGNEVKKTTTSELGLYSEINGGEYQFVDIDLDKLQAGNYYVEFEYCGITYQSVNAKLNKNTGSKAIDTSTRNVLDSKFTSVNGNGSQTLGINGVTVNYNGISNYTSTVKNHTGCNVYARTNEAGYNLYSGFTPTSEEIRYVNLGLFIKAQTDFALTQDLYDVRVDVNGFSHIYRYSKVRYNEDGSVDEESSWNVGVKFQKNTGTYDRAIYTADAEYEAPNHKDNELKVYVTYKIALKNESSYLGRINNIVDYCDIRYNLISAGTSIDDKDNITGNINFGAKTSYNNKYAKYIIDVNSVINPSETNFIYLQFEMNREAVLTVINNGELLNNVTEINSYTTFKENNINKPVAVIDKDSVPGNTIPGNINTYEDDTDAARSLKLELRNARTLSGTVFIDNTGKDNNTVYSGQERIGNGIYDSGETTLNGIAVKLHEIGKDDSSYDGERIDMETKTDENGNFEFVGYIPGNYTVTYTWGDKTYKVQYYKGTIYDENRDQNNVYWYKDNVDIRKTDALDNSDIRIKIDDEMEALRYNTLEEEINKAYDGGSNYITYTSMNSTTPAIAFSVEYETTITDGTVEQVRFAIKNIDFGIVERPKQKLELRKRISQFKITLANGQTLVDATVTEDGKLEGITNYTTYMGPTSMNGINVNGMIRTEIDPEIIEGATLEITYVIKVTNIGELDYTSKRYYYYGNSTDSDKVKVSVTELIDYLDGRLSMIDDKWQEKDKDYLDLVNASQKDNEAYMNSVRTYLTKHLSKALVPGDSNEVNLHTSKLLTSTDDNTFDNQSEIAEVTKTDGFHTGTPVKVVWNNDKFYFETSYSETAIIIPSTGKNANYIMPIVTGITVILALAVGVIVVKKYKK